MDREERQEKFCAPRYIIAVAAGKGGVGKSTVAVNLAHALHKSGFAVGILDADVYGPSLGRMMPAEKFPVQEGKKIIPGESFGVKVFSNSYLTSEEDSMSVRAPIVNGWIKQCVEMILWGDLDYLLVDFPPGTGDIQLTLMQELSFSGAILVTTPQEVAISDVKKAAHMFHQMGVPIIGVVENMAYLGESKPFGEGGGKKVSSFLGAPFLGQIPIDSTISQCGDLGLNTFSAFPDFPVTHLWKDLAFSIRDLVFEQEILFGECMKEFAITWREM